MALKLSHLAIRVGGAKKVPHVSFEILVQIFVGTLPDDISEPLVSTKKLRFNFDSDSIPQILQAVYDLFFSGIS